MKQNCILAALLLSTWIAYGQGFIIDQQATNGIDGVLSPLGSSQPAGQSFTPSLSAVGFVSLYPFNSSDSFMAINLRTNSITGPILATSSSVFIPGGFDGITNFIFDTAVNVASGTTYYLQPVVISGAIGLILVNNFYSGGTMIANGNPSPSFDLWFQEGIIAVPEPSAAGLVLLGGGILFYFRRQASLPLQFSLGKSTLNTLPKNRARRILRKP